MLNHLGPLLSEEVPWDNPEVQGLVENSLFTSQKNHSVDILKIFLNEMGRYQRLSDTEVANYSKLAQKGDKEARDKLVNGNLRLVVKMAKRYRNKGVDFLDLIQEGTLGLMKAIKKFNPDKGVKFSTYACYWIEQAFSQALMNKGRTIRLPIHVIQEVNRLCKELNKSEPISPQTIAIKLNKKVGKVHTLLSLKEKTVSYDVMNENGQRLIDFIPDDSEEIEERIGSEELNEKIMHSLKILSPKQKEIIIQRFGLNGEAPKTLLEVGEYLNLSRERIRQLEEKGLAKLKTAFKEEGISMDG